MSARPSPLQDQEEGNREALSSLLQGLTPSRRPEGRDEEERSHQSHAWKVGDTAVSRSLLVFLSQVFLIYIVVGFSIYNLTFGPESTDQKLWVATLASGIGYILPSPSLRSSLELHPQ